MTDSEIAEYTLRLGDDALVLGHRLSEWCAHAPELEEDLALANIALDCLGQADLLLSLAATFEGKGRSADELTFFRDAIEFRNVQLVELPSAGDFARAISRQFLVDAYRLPLFTALSSCKNEALAGIAAKSVKEITYHLRHSGSWIIRLGDGTGESRQRIQQALDDLWPFVDELFSDDDLELRLETRIGTPRRSTLRTQWQTTVDRTLHEATLSKPDTPARIHCGGGRAGKHTEYLGHMLAEMQSLARAHPGAKW